MSSVSNLTAVRELIEYAIYKDNLTPVHEIIYNAPRDELQILARGLCEELEKVLAQTGDLCMSEHALETAYNALRKEFDATKAELGATKAELGATKAKLDAAEEEGFDLQAELHIVVQEALADKAAARAARARASEALGKLQKELGTAKAKLGATKAQLVAAVAASPRRRSPRLVEVAAKKAAKA